MRSIASAIRPSRSAVLMRVFKSRRMVSRSSFAQGFEAGEAVLNRGCARVQHDGTEAVLKCGVEPVVQRVEIDGFPRVVHSHEGFVNRGRGEDAQGGKVAEVRHQVRAGFVVADQQGEENAVGHARGVGLRGGCALSAVSRSFAEMFQHESRLYAEIGRKIVSDGYALEFVVEALDRRKEKLKCIHAALRLAHVEP